MTTKQKDYNKRIAIDLNEKQYNKLQKFCLTNKLTKAEVVRQLIEHIEDNVLEQRLTFLFADPVIYSSDKENLVYLCRKTNHVELLEALKMLKEKYKLDDLGRSTILYALDIVENYGNV